MSDVNNKINTTKLKSINTDSLKSARAKLGTKGILLSILGLLLVWSFFSYRGIAQMSNSVDNKLSNIEADYQRRADLIPNLVSTVKGVAGFEQETLTKLVEARAKATSMNVNLNDATPEQIAQYQANQGQLSVALGRFLSVSENYPDLQATQSFRDLQTQLEGTENRLAVARKDYNNAVLEYNNKAGIFPGSIIASLTGYEKKSGFQADAGAKVSPKVDFTTPAVKQ